MYYAIIHRIARYEQQMCHMEQAKKEKRVFVLRPQIPPIPLFTQNEEKIRAYYQHGCDLVKESWSAIYTWLQTAPKYGEKSLMQ